MRGVCGWGVWVVGDRGFRGEGSSDGGGPRRLPGAAVFYLPTFGWMETAAFFSFFISVPTSLCRFARTDYAAGWFG